MAKREQNKTVELALGRIFGMMQRASQPGDVAEYERCRSIILGEIGCHFQPEAISRPPLPGWNFGSCATGCVE